MSDIAKLTISLPQNLISFADKLSKERNTSRSGAIASVLQELAEERERAEMIEGYKALAEQNREFTAMALPLASEVLPEWK
jgi:metal-responsive CopG/Arc/MetJ family transcriptional regulator